MNRLLISILCMLLNILSGGFVLLNTYKWFILPIYNLPNINYMQASALYMFTWFFKFSKRTKEEKEGMEIKEYINEYLFVLCAMWFYLGICWLFKTYCL